MTHSANPAIGQIEKLVDNVPGWTPIDQLFSLFVLAYTTEAQGDILELGSWCGRSASALAYAASLIGNVTVHCVDLFPERKDWRKNPDGTYSFAVNIGDRLLGAYEEQTVWAEPYERDIAPIYEKFNGILEVFNQTMTRNGFSEVVRPWKGDLASFAERAPQDFKCRLAFIDGDHGYDAVCADIAEVERYLSEGGWICFDDAFSVYEGVNRAITERIIGRPDVYEHGIQLTRKLYAARRRRRSGT
jgi:predicted O-methyltransferase YrrM